MTYHIEEFDVKNGQITIKFREFEGVQVDWERRGPYSILEMEGVAQKLDTAIQIAKQQHEEGLRAQHKALLEKRESLERELDLVTKQLERIVEDANAP